MITETATPILPNATTTADRLDKARAACRRMPPLWPLKHFVAVNPFLGLAERPFIEACNLLRRIADGGMLMPAAYFREQWETGRILPNDLAEALAHAADTFPEPWKSEATDLTVEALQEWIKRPLSPDANDGVAPILTVAETLDHAKGTQWNFLIIEEIARFCAAYHDAGQSAWRLPWQGQPLFAAWQAESTLDAGPESLGLRGFRAFVAELPKDAATAIDWSLDQLGFENENVEDFFHRQLMSIRGWAGAVQYRVRENAMRGQEDESLLHLLAIRLAYDVALSKSVAAAGLSPAWREFRPSSESECRDLLTHALWHSAFEHAGQRELLGKLAGKSYAASSSENARKAAQAVFCIDVRSEVFRRALESVSPNIETLGFAGFFGLPIEYLPFGQRNGGAQCPVLLTPAFRIRETPRGVTPAEEEAALRTQRFGKRIGYAWNSFKTSAVSCFSFVETAGLAFAPKLVRDAFLQPAVAEGINLSPTLDPSPATGTGLELNERVQLALGALRHMGLTDHFARIVLLCGHGSRTVNNPYGSGLDCGACGGHTGEANARVGAAILNDPNVRAELVPHGIRIPSDTWFLAGLHNTTTDDVTLFDRDAAPASHGADVTALESALAAAGQTTRSDRAPLLDLDGTPAAQVDTRVRERSRDWAQVRPEWGLAGNAAFIVAPRERTRGVNLGGRAFLHNYNAKADAENRTLELIMTAPMVVTNWINLQYYASTVNNAVFGSGNKVLHNVVGTQGVCLGNGGDLQSGLPLQSVHDGERWIHEPHRLNVLIEAPREKIAAVIAKHESVRQLVDHGWLHLFAWEEEARVVWRYRPGVNWERIDA